jgi:hypothetical protein
MTILKIQINLDNAAFEDNPSEIKTLLQNISFDIAKGYVQSIIRDTNGNIVGDFVVEED